MATSFSVFVGDYGNDGKEHEPVSMGHKVRVDVPPSEIVLPFDDIPQHPLQAASPLEAIYNDKPFSVTFHGYATPALHKLLMAAQNHLKIYLDIRLDYKPEGLYQQKCDKNWYPYGSPIPIKTCYMEPVSSSTFARVKLPGVKILRWKPMDNNIFIFKLQADGETTLKYLHS